ncbi:MAG: response regulator transcription factor [Anaerolineae bacterium]|nr:response regulator transcription factor [Caldilineales bacterium]MCX7851252.1 response regulator transcription factor [Caldilineales bacterium]MDW8267612.1 response regulator transcription factor [Anaerolineae bacterium]
MDKDNRPRILIIEDEPDLRKTLKMNLKEQGYKVFTAADGQEGLEKARSKAPDLILLDLMLPGLDGLSLLRAVRQQSDVPVLVLTARTADMDKIIGLESGADDYITKPFSLGELLARVRALLRRARSHGVREVLSSGGLTLDLVSRRATLNGKELNLSPKEFSLLAELMRHEHAVLSRDLLLTRIWGYDFVGDSRTVDVHIRWLREKIETDPSRPMLIQTVRGIGYRFEGSPTTTTVVDEDEDE